jgi:cell division protein FtsA
VLPGGGSQLFGVREMAATLIGKQVHLGRPKQLPGLVGAVHGPAFSTALGMLDYVTKKPMEEQMFDTPLNCGGVTFGLNKVMSWFKGKRTFLAPSCAF